VAATRGHPIQTRGGTLAPCAARSRGLTAYGTRSIPVSCCSHSI